LKSFEKEAGMRHDPDSIVHRIEQLFVRHGYTVYDDSRREPVTALEHALQCAQLAEWAHADTALVAAALLHDLGHFLVPVSEDVPDLFDDRHEERAVPFLARAFGPEVVEPVRLHVLAKRYLVSTDARYAATLSAASQHSLVLQGGPMDEAELTRFQAMPHSMDALQLRRWDDLAKVPGKATPPLGYYLALLESVEVPPRVASHA
jgi:phosphonate degradation associated HDIG domain protein